MNTLKAWRIFVPSFDNDGNEYPVDYHNVWDRFVVSICGGSTIERSAKGYFHSNETDILMVDKVVPVIIVCSNDVLKDILEFTKKYYKQEKVMAYKLSDEVVFV